MGSLASNCTMGTTACCLTHICRRTIHRGRAHRSCTQTTFWSAMGMRIMSVMRWRCPSTTMRRSSQRRSLDIFWKRGLSKNGAAAHWRQDHTTVRHGQGDTGFARLRCDSRRRGMRLSGADRRQDDLFCRRYGTVWRHAAAWAVESDRLRFSADRRSVHNGS